MHKTLLRLLCSLYLAVAALVSAQTPLPPGGFTVGDTPATKPAPRPSPPVLHPIGNHPTLGNFCAAPFGPGPCGTLESYLRQATSRSIQLPAGFTARTPQRLVERGLNGEVMCATPFGRGPCLLLAQLALDMMRAALPPQNSFDLSAGITDAQVLAQQCASQVGMDVALFAACTGRKVVLTPEQQGVLDCAVNSTSAQTFANCAAPKLGYSIPADQKVLAGCAAKAAGLESLFRACAGVAFQNRPLSAEEQAVLACAKVNPEAVAFGKCAASRFMTQGQKAVLNCAVSASDARSFAACAAANPAFRMSEDQRVLARCALSSSGDTERFAACAGTAFLGKNLGPNEQKVLGCAASSGGDASRFATCSVNTLFGDNLSREQEVAIECAAQSQGDPVGFATCAGANMFSLQLNPEQQIAVQCVAGTGGQPHAAAGCIASRLTARELSKCLSNGIGGKDGCFGDNNDLVGKNGWVARTFGQIMVTPDALLRGLDQIWGGSNSFLRNPGQIFEGLDSFVRQPGLIFGGPNSVFNNPGQLLPKADPIVIGNIGGTRICVPWC
jgi:hypothetical protein